MFAARNIFCTPPDQINLTIWGGGGAGGHDQGGYRGGGGGSGYVAILDTAYIRGATASVTVGAGVASKCI